MRADFRLDALELIHELLIYMQAACGIDENIVVALVPCKRDRLFGCFNRILRPLFKDRYADLFAEHLKLFDSRGTVDIARDEHRSAAAVLEHERKLCAVRRFTCALKTAEHYHCRRMRSSRKAGLRAAHEVDKLFVDYLYDHLRGSKALHNIRADSSLGDLGGEILGYLVADVRLKQSHTHITHRRADIRLVEAALAFKTLERRFKAFRKTFKCQCFHLCIKSK